MSAFNDLRKTVSQYATTVFSKPAHYKPKKRRKSYMKRILLLVLISGVGAGGYTFYKSDYAADLMNNASVSSVANYAQEKVGSFTSSSSGNPKQTKPRAVKSGKGAKKSLSKNKKSANKKSKLAGKKSKHKKKHAGKSKSKKSQRFAKR